MTPLEQLTATIRQIIDDHGATPAQVETLAQQMIHAIDHDAATADEFRTALRSAFVNARPDARSFLTDSGRGRPSQMR